MGYDKEHPGVLLYAFIFFVLLAIVSYWLLVQTQEKPSSSIIEEVQVSSYESLFR